jgi:hypothetical protein
MKEARLGGQEQGILIPLIPSQSPVPVGLVPGLTPNWGTKAGLTARLSSGRADTLRAKTAETRVDVNFIVGERLA